MTKIKSLIEEIAEELTKEISDSSSIEFSAGIKKLILNDINKKVSELATKIKTEFHTNSLLRKTIDNNDLEGVKNLLKVQDITFDDVEKIIKASRIDGLDRNEMFFYSFSKVKFNDELILRLFEQSFISSNLVLQNFLFEQAEDKKLFNDYISKNFLKDSKSSDIKIVSHYLTNSYLLPSEESLGSVMQSSAFVQNLDIIKLIYKKVEEKSIYLDEEYAIQSCLFSLKNQEKETPFDELDYIEAKTVKILQFFLYDRNLNFPSLFLEDVQKILSKLAFQDLINIIQKRDLLMTLKEDLIEPANKKNNMKL